MSAKVKPIFIVGLQNSINASHIDEISKSIQAVITDYHVLVHTTNNDNNQFQVFYEKDFNDVKFDELKKIVSDSLNNSNQ